MNANVFVVMLPKRDNKFPLAVAEYLEGSEIKRLPLPDDPVSSFDQEEEANEYSEYMNCGIKDERNL